jgi:putative transposase
VSSSQSSSSTPSASLIYARVRFCRRTTPALQVSPARAVFLGPFSAVCNQLRPRRHRLSAHHYREIMRDRFRIWQEVVGTARP